MTSRKMDCGWIVGYSELNQEIDSKTEALFPELRQALAFIKRL